MINKRLHKNTMRQSIFSPFYKAGIIIFGLLTLASCSVIEPIPQAYPPSTRHIPTTRPIQVPKPVTKPVTKKPEVQRTRPVITVQVDKPEQGANPYDDIPDRGSSSRQKPRITSASAPNDRRGDSAPGNNASSPAVKGLLRQAKLDMAVKNNGAAINKLERALRMDAQNPLIWHQLAKANYNDGKDARAISMAKKSNIYTAENGALERLNWQLIRSASKRSGDIRTLKAAIRYDQTHPQ